MSSWDQCKLLRNRADLAQVPQPSLTSQSLPLHHVFMAHLIYGTSAIGYLCQPISSFGLCRGCVFPGLKLLLTSSVGKFSIDQQIVCLCFPTDAVTWFQSLHLTLFFGLMQLPDFLLFFFNSSFAPSDLNKQNFLCSELLLKPVEKDKAVGWSWRCPCAVQSIFRLYKGCS